MHIDALSVLCAQLTRDLLAIAKFLFIHAFHPEPLIVFPYILMQTAQVLCFLLGAKVLQKS